MTFWKAKGGWGNKRQGFLVFIKIDVCAFKLSNHKGLEQVSAVLVILLFLSLEDLMKNFSHSWDSTHWATEYPCSCSVLSLERALVRTEQKQDLFCLLWCLWLSLNAVLQTTSIFFECFWCRLFLFLVQIFSQCLRTIYLIAHICVLFNEMSSFFKAFFSGAWYQLPAILDLSAFGLCDLMFWGKSCYLLLHFLLVSWQFPWFFSPFLSVFQAWYLRREGNNFKPWSLTQQSCSLKLTISLLPSDSKAFSLFWGDGCICWCYLEYLGKWRELSSPPGDFWHTLRNLARS